MRKLSTSKEICSPSDVVMVWLSIGGIRDLFRLYRGLQTVQRDLTDDGTVRDHDYQLKDGETAD